MNHYNSYLLVAIALPAFAAILVALYFLGKRDSVRQKLGDARQILKEVNKQAEWDERARLVDEFHIEFIFLVLQSVRRLPPSGGPAAPQKKPKVVERSPRNAEHLEAELAAAERDKDELDKVLTQVRTSLGRMAPFLRIDPNSDQLDLVWMKIRIGMSEKSATVIWYEGIGDSTAAVSVYVEALAKVFAEDGWKVSREASSTQPDANQLLSKD